MHILEGAASEATIGGPSQRRHIAAVSIQIFDKENNTESTIRSLADQLEAMFINQYSRLTISPVEWIDFDTPSLSQGQEIEGLYQRNLVVTFQRNEFK